MIRVAKLAGGLTALSGAALLVVLVVVPGLRRRTPPPTPPGPAASTLAIKPDDARRIERASDLVAPDLIRSALAAHRGEPVEKALAELLTRRGEQALARLRSEVDDSAGRFRYAAEVLEVQRYRNAWRATPVAKRMDELLADLREEQAALVQARQDGALRYLEAGRYDAARESLVSAAQLEPPYEEQLSDFAVSLERRIRVRQYERARSPTPEPPRTTPQPAHVAPSPPPALPGYPHPDVKRLAEARDLARRARELFAKGRYGPAQESLEKLEGYYADLGFVKRRIEALRALQTLAIHGARGVAGLFHASKVVRKGSRVRLRYDFAKTKETLDWEELQTIPHRENGRFAKVRGGVRGTGVATYLLRAWFANDVVIRCTATPRALKSYGLVFCQEGLESRQIMCLVSNHWFVEGENYVKQRPGHGILMFGKGVNADVPVDSPEMGFIFRGPTLHSPQPEAGETIRISFSLQGERMKGEIECQNGKGSRGGRAVGDDGRGIERVRPGLFVLENRVTFGAVTIEGKLHRSFEQQRVAELLDLAAGFDVR